MKMAGEPNSVQCTKLTIFLAITTVVFLIISVVCLTLLVVEINKAKASECPAEENGREDPPQVNQNAHITYYHNYDYGFHVRFLKICVILLIIICKIPCNILSH